MVTVEHKMKILSLFINSYDLGEKIFLEKQLLII